MTELIYQAFQKSSGVSIDTRTISQGNIFFALRGPNFDGNKYAAQALEKGAGYVVVDDPVLEHPEDERYILVENSLKALQDLATHHRHKSTVKIIGITGSNGKTTTKELLAAVLSTKHNIIFTQGNLNNHIGVPLTLLTIRPETEIAIIEMGANKVGDIAELCGIAQPDYGMITNIGKAHLEGFGSIEGVKKGKGELYDWISSAEGTLFVHSEDQVLSEMAKKCPSVVYYSSSRSLNNTTEIDFREEGGSLHLSLVWDANRIQGETKLYGAYNIPNMLAAINMGYFFEVDPKHAVKAISEYVPNNSRSQRISTKRNEIYLDAYNANPTSMEHALKSFAKVSGSNKVVILGDMFELGELSKELHQFIAELATNLFDNVIIVGQNFELVEGVNASKFQDGKALVAWIKDNPFENKTILLKGSRGMAMEQAVDLL